MASNRYDYIDSLRGMSAALVIVGHCISKIVEPNTLLSASSVEMSIFRFINTFLDFGKIGVVVFFCVSGYLIPNSLRSDRSQPIRKFVISRIFRLYPAYWVSIPFAIVALYHLTGTPLSAVTIVANFTMLQQFVGMKNIQGLYWTLQIEIIFYAICVGLFYLGLIHKNRTILAATMVCILAALAMAMARYLFEVKMPVAMPLSLSVMFGANLYRRYKVEGDALAGRYAAWCTGVFAAAILPICFLAYNMDYGYGETWYRYFISYFVSLTTFYVFTDLVKIEAPAFTYLGRVSYSMYLFGTVSRVFSWMALGAVTAACPALVAIVAALVGAIAIASLVYYVVEKPAVELGRRLSASRMVAQAAP